MYVTALAFSLDFCGTAHALSVFLHVLTFHCHCKWSQSVEYKKRLTDWLIDWNVKENLGDLLAKCEVLFRLSKENSLVVNQVERII